MGLRERFNKVEYSEYGIDTDKCEEIADEIDSVIQCSTEKNDPYGNLLSLEYWQEVKKEINNL